MTEDEKKQAICLAAAGATVGILCLNTETMKNMAMRMRDAAKDYAEGNEWKTVGEWIKFPESKGSVRVFVNPISTTHDHLFLDPLMLDAQDRLMNAKITVRPI